MGPRTLGKVIVFGPYSGPTLVGLLCPVWMRHRRSKSSSQVQLGHPDLSDAKTHAPDTDLPPLKRYQSHPCVSLALTLVLLMDPQGFLWAPERTHRC